MINLQHIRFAYFLGIGGIGMSALARYFRHLGLVVAGYDRTPTELTKALAEEGIALHYSDCPGCFPAGMNPYNAIIIYTPAVPDKLKEYQLLKEQGFSILKRAQVLGMICNDLKCLAVAGTHGKTTVSTMAATIMHYSLAGCSAILGGISKNFDTNLLLPRGKSSWIVTEADEFDRSFLNLTPEIALITSVDADHLDIYGNHGAVIDAFIAFIRQIKKGGKVVIKAGLNIPFQKRDDIEYYSYGMDASADFYPVEIHFGKGPVFSSFSIQTPWGFIPYIEMGYPGLLNIENAVGAASAAILAGASFDEIKAGLQIYKGVKRRFDIRFSNSKIVFIDDYAHHPEELKAFIHSVIKLFPDKRITGIFQPHLFTRTRDFSAEFARSLDMLDDAIILPVYPARESAIEGVSSELIFNQMKIHDKQLLSKEMANKYVEETEIEVLLTMGAGDIDAMVDDFVEILKNKFV